MRDWLPEVVFLVMVFAVVLIGVVGVVLNQ